MVAASSPVIDVARRSRSPLRRHPDFLRLWAAQSVSEVGDAITRLAVPLVAISLLHATPFEVGVLGAAQFLPFLLVGLPAGAIIDRLVHKRRILVLADVGRALCIGTVPLAYALDALTLPQLYITTFINGCLTVFFDVAASAYVPALVGDDQLVDANSKLELSRSAAQIIGPGTAGPLIQWTTAPTALLADAGSFLASASFLSRIRRLQHTAIAAKQPLSSLAREVVAGTGYVLRQPYLRAIATTSMLANLFRSTLLAVLLIYLIREAHQSPSAIGWAMALGNIGFLTGAATAAALSRRFGVGRTMRAAVAAFGPAALIVAIAPTRLALYAVGAMILIDSFGVVLHGVNQVSLRQAITPDHLRGRMTATIRFLIFGAIPLGTTLGGILGSTVGLRHAIWTATGGLFLAAIPIHPLTHPPPHHHPHPTRRTTTALALSQRRSRRLPSPTAG